MSTSDPITEFADFWRLFNFSRSELIHPNDDIALVRRSQFELSLIPLPVVGDLRRPDVLILMLNPGFDNSDVWWERENPCFRETLKRNLLQDVRDSEYPLFYLDPQFAAHPGADYWYGDPSVTSTGTKRKQRKLKRLVEAVSRFRGCSLGEARREVAQKIAIVQQVPYHSRAFGSYDLLRHLYTARKAVQLIKALLGQKLIIATRAINHWGFSGPVNSTDLVVYPKSWATSASLSPQSWGGAAILHRLLQNPS